jgi:hypothetical protein
MCLVGARRQQNWVRSAGDWQRNSATHLGFAESSCQSAYDNL